MAEGLSHEKNSKVLCRYFLQGVCRHGSSCAFSHSHSDKPSSVCVYYQRGNCFYGSNCRYDHVKNSTGAVLHRSNTANQKQTSSSKSQVNAVHNSTQLQKLSKSNVTSENEQNIKPAASSMVTLAKSTKIQSDSKSSTGQLSAEKWVTASEFVPGQTWKGLSLPGSYSDAAKVGVQLPSSDEPTQLYLPPTGELCPFYAYGECLYGDQCSYIHGEICEFCQLPVLMPFDTDQQNLHFQECLNQHEKAMEESFAADRSKNKVCGICMEVVWEKEPETARRFGVLSSCCHVYCLDCIRKWRGAKQFENKVIRACPECRVKSDFVTPSKYWVETMEDKEKLINEYKQAMSKKPCRYFNQGKGDCPFNNKCFYLHAYPDGRLASPRPWRRRHRQDADGETSVVGQILLWDFLDEFEQSRTHHVHGDSSDDDGWRTFIARLEMLGLAIPDDDDDDDEIDDLDLYSVSDISEDEDAYDLDDDYPPPVTEQQ